MQLRLFSARQPLSGSRPYFFSPLIEQIILSLFIWLLWAAFNCRRSITCLQRFPVILYGFLSFTDDRIVSSEKKLLYKRVHGKGRKACQKVTRFHTTGQYRVRSLTFSLAEVLLYTGADVKKVSGMLFLIAFCILFFIYLLLLSPAGFPKTDKWKVKFPGDFFFPSLLLTANVKKCPREIEFIIS